MPGTEIQPDETFPEVITTLAGAYEKNSSVAAQAWYAAAAATILAFVSFTGGGQVSYGDFSIGLPWAPIFVFALTVLLNVSFCSAYMKQSTTARLFRDEVDDRTYEIRDGERILSGVGERRREHFLTLMPNFLNTTFPLARKLGELEGFIYFVFKVPTDLLLIGIPIAGCMLGLAGFSAGLATFPSWLASSTQFVAYAMFLMAAGATLRVGADMASWVTSSVARARYAMKARRDQAAK